MSPGQNTAPGRFPVRIEGQLGAITIEREPKRVVALGQDRDVDAAVALGVVPLATPDLSGFVPGGVTPWVEAKLTGARPELLDIRNGLPLERVAALRPDLILGTDRTSLKEEYAMLSRIAPTLSYAAGYNKDTWQVTTGRIGMALGRAEQATALVADVEGRIRSAKATNPSFQGKTFTVGPVQPDGTISTINSETDASAIFMSQLGLTLSPKVTALPQAGIPGRALVSPERLDLLDADVLILAFFSAQARTRLERQPLFRGLRAVQRGAYIPIEMTTALAMAFPSALSVPYALGQIVPKIARAISQ